MFAGSHRLRPAEPIAPLADALADALLHAGDDRSAIEALALAAPHVTEPQFALRRGERALARGDAATALRAMVPAWEAGWDDTDLGARLALTALVLGMYDVAGTLTDDAPSLGHRLVRWVLDQHEGEAVEPLDLTRTEVCWALRALITQLDRCGRDDLAWLAWSGAVDACPEAAERLGEMPMPPPPKTPFSPPLDGRAAFRDAWAGPASDAVFSWAWAAGRNVLSGERTLLLTPDVASMQAMFAHGRLTTVEAGLDGAEPEALDVLPSRWNHVVAALWLEQALNPLAALQRVAQALTHEGQLHLLCAGPRAEGPLPMRLSPAMIERACARAGLEILGVAARSADGTPVNPAEAAVVLLHAERRLI